MKTITVPKHLSNKIRTFDEWSQAGYRIEKGSKAVARREGDGQPLFLESQVYKPYHDGEWDDWENDMAYHPGY